MFGFGFISWWSEELLFLFFPIASTLPSANSKIWERYSVMLIKWKPKVPVKQKHPKKLPMLARSRAEIASIMDLFLPFCNTLTSEVSNENFRSFSKVHEEDGGEKWAVCAASTIFHPLRCFSRCVTGEKGGERLIFENAEKYLPIKLKPSQMCIIIIVICCIEITWSDFSVLPHWHAPVCLPLHLSFFSLAWPQPLLSSVHTVTVRGQGRKCAAAESRGEFASPRAELQNSAGFRSAS